MNMHQKRNHCSSVNYKGNIIQDIPKDNSHSLNYYILTENIAKFAREYYSLICKFLNIHRHNSIKFSKYLETVHFSHICKYKVLSLFSFVLWQLLSCKKQKKQQSTMAGFTATGLDDIQRLI